MNALIARLMAALLIPLALLQAPPGSAQESTGFSAEQLEQLVAPIALYPDSLLTQILMASTYPLEVVEAQRWQSRNPALKDKELDAALQEQGWDPSVKSLVAVPDVLNRMSENLDWTQDLGDAFLAQRSDVMDTVQRMRQKAREAGSLQTTAQQVVKQQPDQIIVIEQANPQIVYVPTYSPTVVYGAWSYPRYYYPPMYYPPPPGYGLMAFGVGVAVGAALWGDCHWGWGRGDVNININRYNEFNRYTSINSDRLRVDARQGNRGGWQHDPAHRKGVNYRSRDTARKYGSSGNSNRITRDQARGFSQSRPSTATGRPTPGTTRPAVAGGGRPQTADRPSSARQPATNRPATTDRSRAAGGSNRNSAYSGSRSPSFDRSASARGSMSRGTPSFGGGRSMQGGGGARRR